MEGMSVADYLAIDNNRNNDGFGGSNSFLWFILLLAFSGNGFGFGNRAETTQVERDVLQTSCATQREVLDSRYTTQLGFQNLGSQLASCCCDLKTAIHAEGEQTRALITQNTIQELRDNLQAAQLQLGNLSQTNTLINTLRPFPTPAYITCSPYTSAYGCGGFGFNGGCNGSII